MILSNHFQTNALNSLLVQHRIFDIQIYSSATSLKSGYLRREIDIFFILILTGTNLFEINILLFKIISMPSLQIAFKRKRNTAVP